MALVLGVTGPVGAGVAGAGTAVPADILARVVGRAFVVVGVSLGAVCCRVHGGHNSRAAPLSVVKGGSTSLGFGRSIVAGEATVRSPGAVFQIGAVVVALAVDTVRGGRGVASLGDGFGQSRLGLLC